MMYDKCIKLIGKFRLMRTHINEEGAFETFECCNAPRQSCYDSSEG
jgi:hypothetical protein